MPSASMIEPMTNAAKPWVSATNDLVRANGPIVVQAMAIIGPLALWGSFVIRYPGRWPGLGNLRTFGPAFACHSIAYRSCHRHR